jgi:transmembrane sensor
MHKKSFIVHTGNIKTQVLGTSFNVKAYPEDNFIKVDVVTGKVGVIAALANANRFSYPCRGGYS